MILLDQNIAVLDGESDAMNLFLLLNYGRCLSRLEKRLELRDIQVSRLLVDRVLLVQVASVRLRAQLL